MRAIGAGKSDVAIFPHSNEWQVATDCPKCKARLFANVQAGPWSVPDEDVSAATDHETDPAAFEAFEARRAAGKVKHRQSNEMTTELWCFRCEKGVSVTVTGE